MSTAIQTSPVHRRTIRPAVLPEKIEHCELRSDSTPQATVISVTHGGREVRCNLSRNGNPILSGVWHSSVSSSDGLLSKSCWSSICSEVNDEAAYVELDLQAECGIHIERQVFLARRDGFAFLADVVKFPSKTAGEYQMRLPLAAQISWNQSVETNEGTLLRGRSRAAKVIPLSLPEWQVESSGRLLSMDGHLQLSVPIRGERLHAAVFIDLDNRRVQRPLTWRRLTVGESLQSVPSEVAAGYRIQIGKSQWLVYRSLDQRSNRTVLGQNFSSEFVVARFPPSGMAEKLLEIE